MTPDLEWLSEDEAALLPELQRRFKKHYPDILDAYQALRPYMQKPVEIMQCLAEHPLRRDRKVPERVERGLCELLKRCTHNQALVAKGLIPKEELREEALWVTLDNFVQIMRNNEAFVGSKVKSADDNPAGIYNSGLPLRNHSKPRRIRHEEGDVAGRVM